MKQGIKQFFIVLKFELENYFKNKAFVTTTFLLALVIAGVVIIPTWIPGFLGEDEQAPEPDISYDEDFEGESDEDFVEDEENGEEDFGFLDTLGVCIKEESGMDKEFLQEAYGAEWILYEDESKLKKDVEEKTVDAGFVLEAEGEMTYIVNDLGMYDYMGDSVRMSLMEHYRIQYLMDKGLSQEEIWESESFYISMTTEVLGKNSGDNYWYTYILIFVVYFLIIFYGQMIATSVTTEKSNRAIEILVTSVNPNSLICGKVLAGAIAGVLQAAIILGAGFASYSLVKDAWDGMLDILFNIPANVLWVYAIFAVLSYLLYAFIFGMLGALVSKTEDISKSSMPVLMIYIVSFFIAIFGMTSNSNSTLMKVASYIPFTSGNAMFIRVSMGSVELWEILVSAGILGVSCVIAGILAAKIFRFGTLHYGNPIKFTTALKKVR